MNQLLTSKEPMGPNSNKIFCYLRLVLMSQSWCKKGWEHHDWQPRPAVMMSVWAGGAAAAIFVSVNTANVGSWFFSVTISVSSFHLENPPSPHSSSLLPLFSVSSLARCDRGRSITCGVGWRWWNQLLLQPGDPVLQFAVSGFVLGQQPGVARLQDVQRARHPLHLLLHLFGVGALRCHLQDDTTHHCQLSGAACVPNDVNVPPSPAVRPSSESVFPSPPAEP